MTLRNNRVLVVNGFPIKNDGTLKFDESTKTFELDTEHKLALGKAIAFCSQKHNFGYITDDRKKKSIRSLAKDEDFVKKHEGIADFDNSQQLSDLLMKAIRYRDVQKCAINYGVGYQRNVINQSTKKALLIYTFSVPGEIYNLKKDIYVKIRFTNKNGIQLHIVSVHQ